MLLSTSHPVAAADPGPLPPATPARWVALESVWFFYGRADLTASEQPKIERIVRYLQDHPGTTIGINLPSDSTSIESGRATINPGRVAAVRAAMIAAGIPAAVIQEGSLADRSGTLDREILVMAQAGVPPASADG